MLFSHDRALDLVVRRERVRASAGTPSIDSDDNFQRAFWDDDAARPTGAVLDDDPARSRELKRTSLSTDSDPAATALDGNPGAAAWLRLARRPPHFLERYQLGKRGAISPRLARRVTLSRSARARKPRTHTGASRLRRSNRHHDPWRDNHHAPRRDGPTMRQARLFSPDRAHIILAHGWRKNLSTGTPSLNSEDMTFAYRPDALQSQARRHVEQGATRVLQRLWREQRNTLLFHRAFRLANLAILRRGDFRGQHRRTLLRHIAGFVALPTPRCRGTTPY